MASKLKRKHTSLTLAEKREIILSLESGINYKELMKAYNVVKSTIYHIKGQREQIMSATSSSDKRRNEQRKTLRTPKEINLDNALYEWFLWKQSEGMAISGPMLIAKGKSLAEDMNVSTPMKFSNGWLNRFKQRHGIKKLSIDGESRLADPDFLLKQSEGEAISEPLLITASRSLAEDMNVSTEMTFSQGWLSHFKDSDEVRQLNIYGETHSADPHLASEFSTTFEKFVKDLGLTADQIYNADETGLNWKCLPTKILAASEEKFTVGFNHNKEKITVLVCANASGNHKLELLVIGKSKKSQAFRGITHLPVTYRSQESAWMNKDIFREWFFEQFVQSVKQKFRENGKPENSKCLLILDNCIAHPNESDLVSDCGNIFACYLPPNLTSLLQPMEQGVIRSLKCLYKSNVMLQMMNSNTSPVAFQHHFTMKDAVFSLATAWNDVKVAALSNAWCNLMPKAIEDSNKDKQDISNHSNAGQKASEIQTIMETIRLSDTEANDFQMLQVEDIEEWINEDDNILPPPAEENYENLMNLDEGDSTFSNVPSIEHLNNEVQISWAEVEHSIQTVMTFLEQNSCFSAHEHLLGHKLQTSITKRKLQSRKLVEVQDRMKYAMEASASLICNKEQILSTNDEKCNAIETN